jgi:hypothetical protein
MVIKLKIFFINQNFFMRKLINLFAVLPLLIFTLSTVTAQVQQAWEAQFRYSSHSNSDHANAVTTDAAGNVYISGNTSYGGTVDESEDGIVTAKYNRLGTKLWSVRFPGVLLTGSSPSMAVDASGNVYVAGRKHRDVAPWAFPCDFVTVKYNSSGVVQWSRVFSTGRNVSLAVYMGLDASGNVYVSGATLGDDGDGAYSGTDYTTIKYNNAGTQQWVRTYNGAAPNNFDDTPGDFKVDADGNSYVTGVSQKDGVLACTTIKYSTTGTELWVSRYTAPGSTYDKGNALSLDGSGNIYIACYSSPNHGQYSTLKYNSDGVLQWAKQYDNANNLIEDRPTSIGLDGSGNIYVTGVSDIDLSSSYNIQLNTIKYNSSGDQQWVVYYGLNDVHFDQFDFDDQPDDHYANLVLGVDGNIYIATRKKNDASSTDFLTLKYDATGAVLWTQEFNSSANLLDEARAIHVDGAGNVYVAGYSVIQTAVENFVTIKYTQCTINCPADITVNNDPGKCGAIVNYPEATTTGDCGSAITYSKASGTLFDIGTTVVTVTSTETGATCSFNVTVVDNTAPVISCPSDKTINVDPGVCYASATSVNAGTATATDNCDYNVAGVRSDGLALTANYSVGNTIIKWTATDASNNTTTCSQTITIVDNVPPTISGESASTYVLSPPNHTMRDVTITYAATDNCAVTTTVSVTSNEPVNGVGDGDTDPDWIISDNTQASTGNYVSHLKLRAERSAAGSGRIYTVTITARDPSGNTSTKTIEIRVPHDIKNPNSGKAFIVNSTVPFEGEFWDKPGKTHTAKWLIDETTTAKATVTEPSGSKNGKVTGSYKLTAPGVYKLQMNVTDQTGVTHYANTAGDLEAIVVIYDPNGGNTYGGGYYNSPAGALRSNLTATGKASYGFAMNYFKNSTYPKGETQFEFKVGSFEFNALNFEYLVISNSMAQFKGTGKIIGGQSGVGFIMTVTDGQLDGSSVDKIRMKIYNKNNGSIIYDNQFGASDAALPTQAVGANSTIVISGTNSSLTSVNTTQKAEMETKAPEVSSDLGIITFPNPSTNNFTINVNAKTNERITMQVVDMYGRIIETKNVNANSLIRFGDRYNPGTYFVRVIQGKQHKEIKLIKLSD